MRIMAIDYGDAHTGIAISDPTGLLAGAPSQSGGRELAGIAIFPFIEKSGRIYEKHLWKCRQYDDFW